MGGGSFGCDALECDSVGILPVDVIEDSFEFGIILGGDSGRKDFAIAGVDDLAGGWATGNFGSVIDGIALGDGDRGTGFLHFKTIGKGNGNFGFLTP